MREVYFIRHAKSSWDSMTITDIDRPLNQRGQRDAPVMAERLKMMGVLPDAIVTSPANRAKTTAEIFGKAWSIAASDIRIEQSIYQGFESTLFGIVRTFSADWQTVLLFGHNPTMTSIANIFSDEIIINVPTCGIIHVVCDIQDWKEFDRNKGKMEGFYFPKQTL